MFNNKHSFFSRRSFVWTVVFATVFYLVGFNLLMIPVAQAETLIAANSTNLYNASAGAPIKASSSAAAVVRVTVSSTIATTTLASVTVFFTGTGFSTSTDLLPIATGTTSGVALYNDMGSSTNVFDSNDQAITLLATSTWGATPAPTTTAILAIATPVLLATSSVNIFYVVIKTATSAVDGHQIVPIVRANDIVTYDGAGPTAGLFTANSLVVDTIAPTSTGMG